MTLTQSQLARQERMLDVASKLAADGGFDAVQMRTVAAEADVALGTLYRYFPSKEHLLVSAMLRQISALSDRLSIRPPQGAVGTDRIIDVLRRACVALQRQPKFTVAVVRALVSGDESVAPAVTAVRSSMNAIVLGALGTAEPSVRDEQVADILSEVWLSALVGWISGVYPASTVMRKLEDAVHLLVEG